MACTSKIIRVYQTEKLIYGFGACAEENQNCVLLNPRLPQSIFHMKFKVKQ